MEEPPWRSFNEGATKCITMESYYGVLWSLMESFDLPHSIFQIYNAYNLFLKNPFRLFFVLYILDIMRFNQSMRFNPPVCIYRS